MRSKEAMTKLENHEVKGELKKSRKQSNEKDGILNVTENAFVKQQVEVKAGKKIALRKDISNITIAEMYTAGFTAYKIAKHFGMTQQGIINRLKKMELWTGKAKGNQFKKDI